MGRVTAVWSTKGGVGVTTISAMLAIGWAERADEVLLIDLSGDLAALLGVPDPPGPGIAEWCRATEPSVESLRRIEVAVRPGVALVHRGSGAFSAGADQLLAALEAVPRRIIVDCGLAQGFAHEVAARAETRLLVVRPCYLTLRSAARTTIAPTGVVLVSEPGRALGLGDVEAVVPAPVVAQIAVDPSIARAIDAGLVTSRLPRSLIRSMGQVMVNA